MAVTHLGCPSCGGALAVAEGQRIVSCQYCGGRSLVVIPDAVPRSVVAAHIDVAAARAAAQRVLSRPTLPAALRKHGRVQELLLCYVPFYEFSGVRLGCFRLQEQERRLVEQPVDGAEEEQFQRWLLEQPAQQEGTRVIEQSYARISQACDLPDLGVESIPLQKFRQSASPLAFEAYDLVALQRRGLVFTPTHPPERVAEDAQWRLRVQGDKTALVERRLRIIYYPVWQARYQYRGRPYEIAVDGVTGSVLRALVPAADRRAAAVGLVLLAVCAVGFGRLARRLFLDGVALGKGAGWIFGVSGGALAFVGGGAVALLLAWIVWRALHDPGDAWLE